MALSLGSSGPRRGLHGSRHAARRGRWPGPRRGAPSALPALQRGACCGAAGGHASLPCVRTARRGGRHGRRRRQSRRGRPKNDRRIATLTTIRTQPLRTPTPPTWRLAMSALAQLRPRGPSPHATARACPPHRRRPALCCAGAEGGGAPAPPAAAPGGARVPAWKAKQAAREAFMAESRAATAAAKEAYRSSSYARPDHAQGGGAPGERARNAAPEGFSTLAALPFVDVLTPEGAWRTRSRRGEVRREASEAHAGCSGTVACARRRLAPQRLAASALLALAANDLGSSSCSGLQTCYSHAPLASRPPPLPAQKAG